MWPSCGSVRPSRATLVSLASGPRAPERPKRSVRDDSYWPSSGLGQADSQTASALRWHRCAFFPHALDRGRGSCCRRLPPSELLCRERPCHASGIRALLVAETLAGSATAPRVRKALHFDQRGHRDASALEVDDVRGVPLTALNDPFGHRRGPADLAQACAAARPLLFATTASESP